MFKYGICLSLLANVTLATAHEENSVLSELFASEQALVGKNMVSGSECAMEFLPGSRSRESLLIFDFTEGYVNSLTQMNSLSANDFYSTEAKEDRMIFKAVLKTNPNEEFQLLYNSAQERITAISLKNKVSNRAAICYFK